MFDLAIVGIPKMQELIEWVKFQNWKHLFKAPVPSLHEEKVCMFYHNLSFFKDGLYLTSQVNEVNITIDEEVISEILRVLTKGTRFLREQKDYMKFLEIYG